MENAVWSVKMGVKQNISKILVPVSLQNALLRVNPTEISAANIGIFLPPFFPYTDFFLLNPTCRRSTAKRLLLLITLSNFRKAVNLTNNFPTKIHFQSWEQSAEDQNESKEEEEQSYQN